MNFWVNDRDLPALRHPHRGRAHLPGDGDRQDAHAPARAHAVGRGAIAAPAHRRRRPHRPAPRARTAEQPGPDATSRSASSTTTRKKLHHRIHGLRVLGAVAELEGVIRRRRCRSRRHRDPAAHRARPSATSSPSASGCNVPVRIVPGVENWMLGHGHDALRDITLDDLLGREPVEVDYAACTQVGRRPGRPGHRRGRFHRLRALPADAHLPAARTAPARQQRERPLRPLARNLARFRPQTTLRLWMANVVDAASRRRDLRPACGRSSSTTRPRYKHVPLMEEHPDEAFRVNVLGTLNVARAARPTRPARSSSFRPTRPCRPSSIMGATKRIAELMVLALARESETHALRRRALRQRHGQPRLRRPDLHAPDRARRAGDRHAPGHDALLHQHPRGGQPRHPGGHLRRPRQHLHARHGRGDQHPRTRRADDPPARPAARRRTSRSCSPARAPARSCAKSWSPTSSRWSRRTTRRSCA